MLLVPCRMAISSLSLPHFKCKWNSVVTHTTGSVCTGFSSSPQAPRSSSSLFLKRYIYPLILLYTSYSGRTCDDVTIFFVKADLFEEGRIFSLNLCLRKKFFCLLCIAVKYYRPECEIGIFMLQNITSKITLAIRTLENSQTSQRTQSLFEVVFRFS